MLYYQLNLESKIDIKAIFPGATLLQHRRSALLYQVFDDYVSMNENSITTNSQLIADRVLDSLKKMANRQ